MRLSCAKFVGLALAVFGLFAHRAVIAGEAETVLLHFLAAEQSSQMEWLGNWLETYNLSEKQVSQLIAAAQETSSEQRRNLLWHALRCTRSRAVREYLMRNLVEDTDETTKIRYVQSLTNLAPFDVPILTALYQSRRGVQLLSTPRAKPAETEAVAAIQPDIQTEIVKLATGDPSYAAYELGARPDYIEERPGVIYSVRDHRLKMARQARAELLAWIARNTTNEEHRLVVILPAYDLLDSAHQKQLALDMLRIVKDPAARARIVPLLCRRYGLDLYPLLVKDDEDESVKLSIVRGLHMLASSHGYSLSSIGHGGETLRYVIRRDPSPKVRDAAKKLLERLSDSKQGPFSPDERSVLEDK